MTDLAIASVGKGGKASGVKVWTVDANGSLAELADGPTFKAFDGGDPYGLCTYRSPRDGRTYVFVTDRDGLVEQYRLDPGETLQAKRVRSFRVGSQAEGIVADHVSAKLYIKRGNVRDLGIRCRAGRRSRAQSSSACWRARPHVGRRRAGDLLCSRRQRIPPRVKSGKRHSECIRSLHTCLCSDNRSQGRDIGRRRPHRRA
jgi:hypothetical protein